MFLFLLESFHTGCVGGVFNYLRLDGFFPRVDSSRSAINCRNTPLK